MREPLQKWSVEILQTGAHALVPELKTWTVRFLCTMSSPGVIEIPNVIATAAEDAGRIAIGTLGDFLNSVTSGKEPR